MKNWFLVLLIFSFFSCRHRWTDKDKKEFYSGCLSNATINKEIKDPKVYCNCLLQKVVAKYPNANDARYIKYDSTVKQMARDCLKLP